VGKVWGKCGYYFILIILGIFFYNFVRDKRNMVWET